MRDQFVLRPIGIRMRRDAVSLLSAIGIAYTGRADSRRAAQLEPNSATENEPVCGLPRHRILWPGANVFAPPGMVCLCPGAKNLAPPGRVAKCPGAN